MMYPEDILQAMKDHLLKEFHRLAVEMPIGSTLCVHDDPRLRTIEADFETDNYKLRIVVQNHVLLEGETCDFEGRKTQYGPKTQEIADVLKWSYSQK
jgi:hypothetical protein